MPKGFNNPPVKKHSEEHDGSVCEYSEESFKCSYKRIEGKNLCIFHDPEYGKENQDNLVNEFKLLVNKANESNGLSALSCRGFYIPDIQYERIKFESVVDFTYAHFKKANFYSAVFRQKVYFYGATFSERANFNAVTFLEQVDFREASFTKGVDFKYAHCKTVDFTYCTIDEMADFRRTEFLELADFSSATFLGPAIFNFCKFNRNVIFSHSKFLKEAYFIWVVCNEGKTADFNSAIFTHRTYFGSARFPEETIFSFAEFDLAVDFSNSHFGIIDKEKIEKGMDVNKAYFTAATFLDHVDFSSANFVAAKFNSASFFGKADFINTTFRIVDFSQSTFSEQTTFYNTDFGYKVAFEDVLFENAQKVLFQPLGRLHATYFINTNVTEVRFSKVVEWDEEEDQDIISSSDLEAVKAVYRNIRENYENSFRFTDADKYHVREMDLKKNYRDKNRS